MVTLCTTTFNTQMLFTAHINTREKKLIVKNIDLVG
jgi:hypothetical protein